MHILVVDDDAVFRTEFSEMLSDDGHEVAQAPSVPKALSALSSDDFDVVFTDLKMPRQSGLDLLGEIRQRWPQIFVVLVTGFATVDSAVTAMKEGAFDYVTKPFRMDQVRSVLGLVAEERKAAAPPGTAEKPIRVARRLAESFDCPILLVAGQSPRSPSTGVEVFEFDGQDLSRVRTAVESFLAPRPRAGVVLDRVDRWLESRRLQDVLDLLDQLRTAVEPHGPFAVGVDYGRLSAQQSRAIRSVVAAPMVHGTLEALASPIRRRILRRLKGGSASFTELMRAAELNDSPKLSFHLRRLVDGGFLSHSTELYGLTPQGRVVLAMLHRVEEGATVLGSDHVVFVTTTGASSKR